MEIWVYGYKNNTYRFMPGNELAKELLEIMEQKTFMQWQLDKLEKFFKIKYINVDKN